MLVFGDETGVVSYTPKIPTAAFPHERLNTWAIAHNMQETCASISWGNESPPQHSVQQ